jgi:zinc transport system substrate-binding protein
MKRAAILVVALLLFHCRPPSSAETIVTSVYPLEFIAVRLAADDFEVAELTKPGAEPHDLELTPRQVRQIEQARLVLYIDSGFQPAVSEAAANNENAINVLELEEIESALIRNDEVDPHIWLDPLMMADLASAVGDRLAELSGSRKEQIMQRTRELKADFVQVDEEYRSGLTTCDRHMLVTSHGAFAYLTRRYDLTQLSITGVDPEAEPSPARLAEVAEQARAANTKTVFAERIVSSKIADALAQEIGANVAVLDPIEGPPPSGDYLSAMRSNLSALKEGLGCR